MKTSANYSVFKISLLVLIPFSILFSSCSGRKSENQNIAYSENTLLLSRKLVSVYVKLDSILSVQEYQTELIKILNDVSPETYLMKVGLNSYTNEMEHLNKLNALRSLEKVYSAYNLQLDPDISTQSSNLHEKIVSASNALDSINLSETLKLKNDKIKFNIKNSKFNIDETIFELTDLYSEFWNEESQKWIMFLEKNNEILKKGIESIPISSFNTEKIKLLVDDPYANSAVLANLYKLNLIKESNQKAKKLENDIHIISDVFVLINQVQGELMKRNRSKLKIQDLNNSIDLLLMD